MQALVNALLTLQSWKIRGSKKTSFLTLRMPGRMEERKDVSGTWIAARSIAVSKARDTLEGSSLALKNESGNATELKRVMISNPLLIKIGCLVFHS